MAESPETDPRDVCKVENPVDPGSPSLDPPSQSKDDEIADLKGQLEKLRVEAQAAVNSLTRQRNAISDQVTQLEIQLAFAQQPKA